MVIALDPGESGLAPYGNFNFFVQFVPVGGAGSFVPAGSDKPAILGAFAEVSGIEASMEHKVIKEGGRNYGTVLRAGPTSFATVILKRGIVEARMLWRWWAAFAGADGATDARPIREHRADVLIGLVRTAKGRREIALGWKLVNAMPVKFRVGDLNARGSEAAVEELHLVCEGLDMEGVT